MTVQRVGLYVLVVWLASAGASPAAHSQGVRFGQTRLNITASRRRLPADGQSVTRIRVEVRGRDDSPVGDGTIVALNTDIGEFVDGGAKSNGVGLTTEGGYAEALLSSEEPGTATVQALSQGSRNQVMVDFSPPDGPPDKSTVVHIRGDWVGFCTDLNIIEARDTELRFRSVVLEAGRLQLDPNRLVVRAHDEVRLTRGDEVLECEEVYLELKAMRGSVRRFGDEGVEEIEFNAYTLQPTDAKVELPEDAYRLDERESEVWMVAKSISIFPGEKVVLRHGKVWVGQRKILTFPPYWVIAFQGYYGSSNSNFAELSSTGGLAIDFPFFFSVTDTTTHAIKIQKGASNGSIMARNKWSAAYELAWQGLGRDAEGSFVIDGLPRQDVGLYLRDRRQILGGADSSLSIAWPNHRSLFTDYSVFKYGSSGHYGVRTHADRQSAVDAPSWSYGVDADFLSKTIPLGESIGFRWGTGIDAGRDAWIDDGFVVEHSMSTYFDVKAWRFNDKKTSLAPTFSNHFAWDTEHRRHNTARGQLSLNHRIAQGINANLRYSLEHRSGTGRFQYSATQSGINQQLSLNMSAYTSKKWDAYTNANYNITDESLYGFGALNYRPFEKWRLGAIATYYEFSQTSFDDLELSVNRAIGTREVGLAWTKSDGRISLEFGAAGF